MAVNKARLILPSAERTATISSAPQRNASYRGVKVTLSATAKEDTPTITPKIQGFDPVAGVYYDMLTGTALTNVGVTTMTIYPGINASKYADDTPLADRKDDVLPSHWRVVVTHGDTDKITYLVSAVYLL